MDSCEKCAVGVTPQPTDLPEAAVKGENGNLSAGLPAVPPPTIPVKRPVSRWLIAAGAVLLVAAVFAGFHFFGNGRLHAKAGSSYPSFVKAPRAIVTVPGFVRYPALSPDGKQVAFTWRSPTHLNDLYVQLIGADQPLQLTHNTSGFVCCGAWSPAGQQIAYGRCDDNGGAVYVVPALGGVERKITNVVCLFGQGTGNRASARSRYTAARVNDFARETNTCGIAFSPILLEPRFISRIT